MEISFNLTLDLKTYQNFTKWLEDRPHKISSRGYSMWDRYYVTIKIPRSDAEFFILTWSDYISET